MLPSLPLRLCLSSAATRYIIHQPYCFVNNFFQIFQKIFKLCNFSIYCSKNKRRSCPPFRIPRQLRPQCFMRIYFLSRAQPHASGVSAPSDLFYSACFFYILRLSFRQQPCFVSGCISLQHSGFLLRWFHRFCETVLQQVPSWQSRLHSALPARLHTYSLALHSAPHCFR